MSLIWLMLEPLEFVKNVENLNTLGVLGPKMKRKERLLTVDSIRFALDVYSKVLFLLFVKAISQVQLQLWHRLKQFTIAIF